MARDHALTLLTELCILASSILLLKLAAAYTGPEGFGQFVLARRLIGWIQLPTLGGIALALTRAVSMTRARGGASGQWAYLDAALSITICTSAVVVSALLLAAPSVAAAATGSREHPELIRAMAPGIAGLVLHGIAYGMLRGQQTMVWANAVQALNLGAVPLLAFGAPRLTVPRLIFVTGAMQLLVSVTALALMRRAGPAPRSWRTIWHGPAKELLRYGVPRVPGEFVLGALSALPVSMATHYGGAIAAGQVGLGQAVLNLLGAVFAPLGLVMLPSVSAQVAAGRVQGLARTTWRVVAVCIGLTACGVLALEVIAPWLLPAVFGPEFAGAVGPVRVMAIGAVPYVVYVVLRNVLDAIHAAPLNALNLTIALGAFGLVTIVGRSVTAAIFGVVAAMTVLGTLTSWLAWHALRKVSADAQHQQPLAAREP